MFNEFSVLYFFGEVTVQRAAKTLDLEVSSLKMMLWDMIFKAKKHKRSKRLQFANIVYTHPLFEGICQQINTVTDIIVTSDLET